MSLLLPSSSVNSLHPFPFFVVFLVFENVVRLHPLNPVSLTSFSHASLICFPAFSKYTFSLPDMEKKPFTGDQFGQLSHLSCQTWTSIWKIKIFLIEIRKKMMERDKQEKAVHQKLEKFSFSNWEKIPHGTQLYLLPGVEEDEEKLRWGREESIQMMSQNNNSSYTALTPCRSHHKGLLGTNNPCSWHSSICFSHLSISHSLNNISICSNCEEERLSRECCSIKSHFQLW